MIAPAGICGGSGGGGALGGEAGAMGQRLQVFMHEVHWP